MLAWRRALAWQGSVHLNAWHRRLARPVRYDAALQALGLKPNLVNDGANHCKGGETYSCTATPGREHLWVARSRVNLLVRGSSLGCASAFSRGSKSVDNQNLGVQLASQMAE